MDKSPIILPALLSRVLGTNVKTAGKLDDPNFGTVRHGGTGTVYGAAANGRQWVNPYAASSAKMQSDLDEIREGLKPVKTVQPPVGQVGDNIRRPPVTPNPYTPEHPNVHTDPAQVAKEKTYDAYLQQPDVSSDATQEARDEAWKRYSESQGVVPKKSFDQIQREAKNKRTWGDRFGGWVSRFMREMARSSMGSPIGGVQAMSPQKFDEAVPANTFDTVGHDAANWAQIGANNLGYGARTMVRTFNPFDDTPYAARFSRDPYKGSISDKLHQTNYHNVSDNIDAARDAEDAEILANMRGPLNAKALYGGKNVSPARKWGTRLLYGGLAGGGQYLGGGGVLRGLGLGLRGGSKVISAASKIPGRGARAFVQAHAPSSRLANATARGVDGLFTEVGKAATLPARVVAGATDVMPYPVIGGTSRVGPTIANAARAARGSTAWRAVTNPGQAFRYAYHHPFLATGRTLGGAMQAYSPYYYGRAGYDMYKDIRDGNPGQAASEAANVGVFGAVPAFFGPRHPVLGFIGQTGAAVGYPLMQALFSDDYDDYEE